MLAHSIEERRLERIKKWQGVNLYVRNLDEEVTEEELTSEFALYGSVDSVKIARDPDGRSRLFGYVCYTHPDEASKAVLATNAWSHMFDELARRQVPVWTYIVLTEPLTDGQLETIGWRVAPGCWRRRRCLAGVTASAGCP